MEKHKKKILLSVFGHKSVLSIFLIVYLIGIIALIFDSNLEQEQLLSKDKMLIYKALSFATYLILAYFAYKNVKLLRWLMALIILISGMSASFAGIFAARWEQFFIKPFFTILGAYFIVGGILLFRESNRSRVNS